MRTNLQTIHCKLIIPCHFLRVFESLYYGFQSLSYEDRMGVLTSQKERVKFSKLVLGDYLFDEHGEEVFDTALAVTTEPEFLQILLKDRIEEMEQTCVPIVQLIRNLAPLPGYRLHSLSPLSLMAGDGYLVQATYVPELRKTSFRKG